jgi:hypothetical protein
MSRSILRYAGVVMTILACGSTGDEAAPSGRSDGSSGNVFGGDAGPGGEGSGVKMVPELWYTVDQMLVHIALNEADGTVAKITSSKITTPLDSGQSAITMLNDGSLLASRLSKTDNKSHLFFISAPPRDGSDVTPASLGVMPDGIMLEGLYTDCEGRLYGMDTGEDDTSSKGNRLLRFTGNVTGGVFTFQVVSDLATASVADIDDMSPGIENNMITDNPGLAIDTGHIHAFNFETGSGTEIAQGGTFGIHALGGPLFKDGRSRLYVLNDAAELFDVNPVTFVRSNVLATGPKPTQGPAGWSSLAGPLTDCKTGFSPPK